MPMAEGTNSIQVKQPVTVETLAEALSEATVRLQRAELEGQATAARLAEVEAELQTMERANETSMGIADSLAGDVERAEAQVRVYREALDELVAYVDCGKAMGSRRWTSAFSDTTVELVRARAALAEQEETR
jgi:hypothetical protein